MSSANVHFETGIETSLPLVHEFDPCASLCVRSGDGLDLSLFFGEPAQIDTLVAALVKLRDGFAAARPDPAVVPLCETDEPTEPKTEDMPIRLEPETGPKCPGCTNLLRTTEETAAGFCEECQAEHKKIAF